MANPLAQFSDWYHHAMTLDVREKCAVTLATATKDGRPSARVVLVKSFDENGFYFYTNLTSRKGQELTENPNAALCFYWDGLGKQVRIEGIAEKVSDEQADAYFNSRPRTSQLGAWASKQSQKMEHQDSLSDRLDKMESRFEGQEVPRPEFWSGFCLKPKRFEFWENVEFRLHHREVFTHGDGKWNSEILFP